MTFGYYGTPEENHPELDNRACYLANKAAILRTIDRQEEAVQLLEVTN